MGGGLSAQGMPQKEPARSTEPMPRLKRVGTALQQPESKAYFW